MPYFGAGRKESHEGHPGGALPPAAVLLVLTAAFVAPAWGATITFFEVDGPGGAIDQPWEHFFGTLFPTFDSSLGTLESAEVVYGSNASALVFVEGPGIFNVVGIQQLALKDSAGNVLGEVPLTPIAESDVEFPEPGSFLVGEGNSVLFPPLIITDVASLLSGETLELAFHFNLLVNGSLLDPDSAQGRVNVREITYNFSPGVPEPTGAALFVAGLAVLRVLLCHRHG